jgi:AcrR family transcriptional regulator
MSVMPCTARPAEGHKQGADKLTMDALAQRAGVGKGTVFRRFRSRAGIFHALLDDDERVFQERVLFGPPPPGPGAPPLERLVAYGLARTSYLIEHREVARGARWPGDGPPGAQSPMSREHIRSLLGHIDLGPADRDVLAVQLTAALDSPPLLYLSSATLDTPEACKRIIQGWEDLVRRVCLDRTR